MTIHSICSDIDGTLLDKERQLSNKTISTIRRVKDKLPVILASSRMPSAMRHLQRELGIEDHPLICYNGGFVIQYSNEKSQPFIFDSVSIPFKICQTIIDMPVAKQVHISLYREDHWYAPIVDNWTEREERITKVKATIMSNEDVLALWKKDQHGAHKIMCMGDEEIIHQMEKQLNEKFGNDIHVYRSRSTYLELAPKAISKGSALNMVLSKVYNTSIQNTISFGDNYNDIDLLKMSGLGVAVENAKDEVKAVANEVTTKSTDDGVAIAIEKYCF